MASVASCTLSLQCAFIEESMELVLDLPVHTSPSCYRTVSDRERRHGDIRYAGGCERSARQRTKNVGEGLVHA